MLLRSVCFFRCGVLDIYFRSDVLDVLLGGLKDFFIFCLFCYLGLIVLLRGKCGFLIWWDVLIGLLCWKVSFVFVLNKFCFFRFCFLNNEVFVFGFFICKEVVLFCKLNIWLICNLLL